MGIFTGIMLFVVILIFLTNYTEDFDQNLLKQVQSNTSTDLLLSEIDKEAENEKLIVQKHFNSHLLDIKYWKPSNVTAENDLQYEIEIYKNQLKSIEEYKQIRTDFVIKKINKTEFLSKAAILKPRIKI